MHVSEVENACVEMKIIILQAKYNKKKKIVKLGIWKAKPTNDDESET